MMKNSIDITTNVFSYLISEGAKASTGISGSIYMTNRPKNSIKEDIVVKTLAFSGAEMQTGVVNVNVHVPNLSLTNDDTQPNNARFKAIVNVLVSMLSSHFGIDYNFEIEDPGTITPDGNNWFANIRLRYYTPR